MRATGIGSMIRIQQKNTQMLLPKRPLYRILALAAILGILLPCAVAVGFMSYVMTEALAEVGNPAGGVLFELQILSAFSMVFGILVVFSVLFFSSDREHLATLPIPAQHLMMGKFVYAYIAESIMECFVLAAVFVGYFAAVWSGAGGQYGLAQGMSAQGIVLQGMATSDVQAVGIGRLFPQVVSLIAAVIGTVLLPLVPMVYCAVFSLVLMACLKRVRSVKVFYHMSSFFLLGFAVLFLCSLRGIGEINIENYVELLGSGGDLFLRTLNKIFFPVPWLAEAVGSGRLRYLLGYLAANMLLLVILYFLGVKLYQQGLYTAAALGSARKAGIRERNFRVRSGVGACLRKEILVLTRTRAFANNCVYVNLIWPAGTYFLLRYTRNQGSMAQFIQLYRAGKERASLILTFTVVFMALIATAMNSIASTSFTREGRHISLVKYIPVSFKKQMYAKALVSVLFTYPPLLAADVILCFFLGAPVKTAAFYAVLMLLAHVIAVAIGMELDSMAPYVTWDDEYSALRGNINTFFNMAVMLLLAVGILGLSLLVYELLRMSFWVYELVLLLVLAGLAVGFTLIATADVVEHMKRL